ncbi:hypothetical protein ACCO45_005642 [Purpureocillium lilacinum]|uniref:Uncharacterized protein n=1 Tax=Purpureocillium lilacinum TaxID=33203 RepID=A0ACC4DW10_PURLI
MCCPRASWQPPASASSRTWPSTPRSCSTAPIRATSRSARVSPSGWVGTTASSRTRDAYASRAARARASHASSRASPTLATRAPSGSSPPATTWPAASFADSGLNGKLRASPEDDEGVDLEVLERMMQQVDDEAGSRPAAQTLKEPGPHRKLYRHVIYTVPTCANPSGKTMTLRRREVLVKLARKRDALIVCDDVYDFLQWPLEGDPTPERPPELRLPRLCDIDLAMGPAANDPQGFGHAVSNGSFSKISGPGVRTGWVEASPAFVTGLSKTASTMSGGAPSQLCAGILSDMVRTGELEKHIETRVRPSLQRRHRLMMDAIREFLVPLGVQTRQSSLAGSQVYGATLSG